MAKQRASQKKTVERVMQEFKEGDLQSSSGDKVTSRKQAVAIALSEAGSSNQKTPAQNRRAAGKARQASPKKSSTRKPAARKAPSRKSSKTSTGKTTSAKKTGAKLRA
ncbi:MAG: hypothetical protein K2X62_05935 [Beijerinckiaceae bacterium]|nr:hypothetical protein [Beijerinckiaceae bacterium]